MDSIASLYLRLLVSRRAWCCQAAPVSARRSAWTRSGPTSSRSNSRAPLTIPPEFDLRPPQPGAPRPQEVTAAEKARKVIDTAGPGEPGKQATTFKVPEGGIGGPGPDPSQQVGDQSLAEKLLGSNDSASGGAVDKRETTPLKGVY